MYIVKFKNEEQIKINKSQAVYLVGKIEDIKNESYRKNINGHNINKIDNIITYKKGNSILIIDLDDISFIYNPMEQ